MNLGTNLTELEKLAKAVTYPYKDDWELKQALVKFDRAANPETILALIALIKQQHEALKAVSMKQARWTDEQIAALDAYDQMTKGE